MKHICIIPCAALAAALLLGGRIDHASAQERGSVNRPDSERAVRLVADRDREGIHPGDPLRVVGVSEGDNNLLEGLPALQNSARGALQVDTNDARARQLALLAGGTHFDRPPRTAALTPAERRRAHVRARTLKAPGALELPETDGEGSKTWIGLLLAAAGTVAFFVTRGRLPL